MSSQSFWVDLERHYILNTSNLFLDNWIPVHYIYILPLLDDVSPEKKRKTSNLPMYEVVVWRWVILGIFRMLLTESLWDRHNNAQHMLTPYVILCNTQYVILCIKYCNIYSIISQCTQMRTKCLKMKKLNLSPLEPI